MESQLQRVIKFGTDGWRGRIAEDFTFDNVRIVTQAIADYFKKNSNSKVIVGYDTRFLSREYAFVVAQVLSSNNLTVLVSKEAVPSPVISYSVVKEKAHGAVMITASHNPPGYNGIKIKTHYGGPANKKITKEIEKYLYKRKPPAINDRKIRITDFIPAYIKNITSYIDIPSIKKARLKVVTDSMHGVGGGYLDKILEGSNCRIVSINKKPDPLFGGIQPEPIEKNLSELKNEVKKQRADVGLATDGDADRISIIDDRGRYLTPHQVFPMLLLYLIEEKKLRGKVIEAVSLGYLGRRIAKHYSLPFEEVAVGFKNVSELMYKSTLSGEDEVLIGGEESGGYGYKGYIPERDGILSGLLLLEMLVTKKQKLSKILTDIEKRFGKSYYERVDVHMVDNKYLKMDKTLFTQNIVKRVPKNLIGVPVKELKTFDGIKIFLEDDSWFLLRPSGTEPVLRIYAEADSRLKVRELIDTGRKLVN